MFYTLKEIPEDWAKMIREDLAYAKKAQERGYTVLTKKPFNPQFGVPHDGLCFEKIKKEGTVHIWQGYSNWRCADIIYDQYVNHRNHKHLIDALEAEK